LKEVLLHFPLHDSRRRGEILADVDKYPFANFPLVKVKDYMGEKVGLYFAFSDHLAQYLVNYKTFNCF
jgi:hypothetical protein